jgi:hypothetical protein
VSCVIADESESGDEGSSYWIEHLAPTFRLPNLSRLGHLVRPSGA